jgi:hypothetical protein
MGRNRAVRQRCRMSEQRIAQLESQQHAPGVCERLEMAITWAVPMTLIAAIPLFFIRPPWLLPMFAMVVARDQRIHTLRSSSWAAIPTSRLGGSLGVAWTGGDRRLRACGADRGSSCQHRDFRPFSF